MAINNEIHKITFKRKYVKVYGAEFTCDNAIILVDTDIIKASKTHDIIYI